MKLIIYKSVALVRNEIAS